MLNKKPFNYNSTLFLMLLLAIIVSFTISSCTDDNSTISPQNQDPTYTIISPLNNSIIEKGITIPIVFDCFNDQSIEFPEVEFFINDLKIQTIIDTPYISYWNTRAFEFGEYQVIISSTTEIGTFYDSVNVVLSNDYPTAVFEVSLLDSGDILTNFTYDASLSYDGGDPNSELEVRWDFDGDKIWDTDWSTEKTIVKRFNEVRVYNTKLEVRDTDSLTNNTTKLIYVLNTPPLGNAIYINRPAANENYIFEFTADELIDLESNSIDLEIQWDFDGDGKWDSEWSLEHESEYQFEKSGIFEYTYQIRDPHGMIGPGVSDTVYVSTSDIYQKEMISIPAGSFTIGYEGDENSIPTHNVTLTNNFEIGKYAITNELYCEMLNNALAESLIFVDNYYTYTTFGDEKELIRTRNTGIEWDASGFYYVEDGEELFPVRRVTWFGAAFYCNMLSHQENLTELYNFSTENWDCNIYTSQNIGYRLPTEAEWEYTARYNDGRNYPWGNFIGTNIHFNNDTGYGSRAVGSYALNGNSMLGLCDLLGNTEEWCNDNYGAYTDNNTTNPTGPEFNGAKVLRGTTSNSNEFHNGLRDDGPVDSHYRSNGFRIVKQ